MAWTRSHADNTALTANKKAALQLSKLEQVHYHAGVFRTLIFKLHSEIFHLGKPLPPGMGLKIRFFYNTPAFFLNGVGLAGSLYEGDIKMSFHVC